MAPTPLIIIGAGETARVAASMVREIGHFEILGFYVEQNYLASADHDRSQGPLFPLEELPHRYDESRNKRSAVQAFVALSYRELNRTRARLYQQVKKWGFTMANIIHPQAWVSPDATLGDNLLIQPQATVGPGCVIQSNVTLCAGVHVAHQSHIGAHTYVASGALVGGFAKIGSHCFLGLGAIIHDRVTVSKQTLVAAGSCVTHNPASSNVHQGNPAVDSGIDSTQFVLLAGGTK